MKLLFNRNMIKQMDTKTCTMCNIEKQINNFYIRYSEFKIVVVLQKLERYFGTKDKISQQKKIFYEKIEKKYYYRNKTIDVYILET